MYMKALSLTPSEVVEQLNRLEFRELQHRLHTLEMDRNEVEKHLSRHEDSLNELKRSDKD